MYGNITRNLTTAGAGPIFTQTCAHLINNQTHCSFIIQDVTSAGAMRLLPLVYIDQATGKGGNQDTISDVTAAARVTVDVLTLAAYSRYDVGPIVNGATRGATAVSPWIGVNYPGHRPMRSLHYNVSFTIPGTVPGPAAAVSQVVSLTHRLGTANVAVFASPTSDPTVTTAGGPRPMIVTRNTTAGGPEVADPTNVVTLQAQTQDNAANSAAGAATVTFDVMVLALPGSGFHSTIARPHGQGTVPLGTFVAGNNYQAAPAGDRQLTAAAAGAAGHGVSYGALYRNVGGFVVAPGVAYVHNMGSSTGAMALVGHLIDAGTGALSDAYIINNATSVDTMTLGRVDADFGAAYVLFVRPYSPYIL